MKRTLIALTMFAAVSVSVAAARQPASGPRACYGAI
jgi:hypothetical protein